MAQLIAYLALPLFLLMPAHPGAGDQQGGLQDTDTRAIIKANFLFNFGVQCDWPQEAKTGRFEIAVFGNDPVYRSLADTYVGKPVGSQVVEVLRYTEISEIESPNILYVGKDSHDKLEQIDRKIGNKPVMIVCEKPGAVEEGTTINFTTEASKIRYELNTDQAARKGILFGSIILQWAVKK